MSSISISHRLKAIQILCSVALILVVAEPLNTQQKNVVRSCRKARLDPGSEFQKAIADFLLRLSHIFGVRHGGLHCRVESCSERAEARIDSDPASPHRFLKLFPLKR